MDRLLLDLRLAFRRLRQNPGFSIVAILTLALGIGANTAIFSVINAVLFRPLPVERSSELVSINETLGGNTFPTLSFPNYRDMRDRNTVLSGLAAYRILPASLGLPGNEPAGVGLPGHWKLFRHAGREAGARALAAAGRRSRSGRSSGGGDQLQLLAEAIRRRR